MSVFRRLADLLRLTLDALTSSQEADAVRVASDTLALVESRIVETRKDADGVPFPNYSQKKAPASRYAGKSRSAGAEARVKAERSLCEVGEKANDVMKVVFDTFGATERLEWQNHFLHTADVFEPGKRLVEFERHEIERDHEIDMGKAVDSVRAAFVAAGGAAVFVGVRSVDGVRPSPAVCWVAEGVQSLSLVQDGKPKWGLFADALTQLGYTVHTDRQMRVVSVR